MFSMKIVFLIVFLLNFPVFPKEDKYLYGFFDDEGNRYIKMLLVGETISVEKASTFELDKKKDLSLWEVDTRPDTVTIKVLNNPGIRPGQILYLLEKHPDNDSYKDGNIVGEVKVLSIFNTTFFGEQIRGEGHLRLIGNKIMVVGLPLSSQNILGSRISKKQGDYFHYKGDTAMAVKQYKQAIKLDPNSPEAHYSIAKLHQDRGEGYISAAYEYSLAYKSKDKFLDDKERFDFLVDYANFLVYKYKLESEKLKVNSEDLDKSIQVAHEARKMWKSDFRLNFVLVEAYFLKYLLFRTKEKNPEIRKQQEELEEKVLDYLKQALEIRSQHSKIHEIAVFFYYEKLKDIHLANMTQSEMMEVKSIRDKLLEHVKLYKIYRNKNKKVNKEVLKAEQYARSL